MPTIRNAAIATVAVFFVFSFYAFYASYLQAPIRYESLPWSSNGEKQSADAAQHDGRYLIGVGKADITGPVVELNLMGYANTSQLGSGLRQRLYSRAFIVGEPDVPENRWIYLVLDTQSGDTAVRDGILEALSNLGPDYAVYGQHNVAVTGTHSHSGPGAWLNYLLPQITSRGFSKESYEAIVKGTLLSIQKAHESLMLGSITVGKTRVEDANINRSLYAYLANPEAERLKYSDNVDKDLTLLRFTRSIDGKDIGVLTWFAVHGTSMLGNNTLISGDNKGVAAYLFEKSMKSTDAASEFVAGFSQANVGDTSPNVLGAYCEDGSDEECRFNDSTCGGSSQQCHGRGPFYGRNDAGKDSCFEIGRRQAEAARLLYSKMASASSEASLITGETVRSMHTFVSLANYTFPHPNGTVVNTCPAALGYSFAAGTSDGPGAFDFKQNSSGSGNASPLWGAVRNMIHAPDKEQQDCQYPKPILLDVGETMLPYQWAPNIVDIQLLRVGQLIIIVSPGEATTMAGRRWREAVHNAALRTSLFASPSHEAIEPVVVLGGPANTYTHYITTEEEYAVQRYEGASTLYGPHTLNAYINLSLNNLKYLSTDMNGQPERGPLPPINTNRSLSFIGGVILDRPGFFKNFGDVLEDVEPSYVPGDIAQAAFVGANPRNNLRLESTYAMIERLRTTATAEGVASDELKPRREIWEPFRTDEDWELVFHWKRTSEILGTSEVRLQWEIPTDTDMRGRYRMRYFGDSKSLGGAINAFEGMSSAFNVG